MPVPSIVRRLGIALMPAALVMGSFVATLAPVEATVSHLSSHCSAAHTGVTPTAGFRHTSGHGYWAGARLRCDQPFKVTIRVKDVTTGATLTNLTRYKTALSSNVTVDVTTPKMDPIPGDTYQVTATVIDDTGHSLGYMTSGTAVTVGPQTRAAYATYILNHSAFDTSGRLVKSDLQNAANGHHSSAGVYLSTKLLRLIIVAGRGHTLQISALESGGTGHASGSYHYFGVAVDFSALDGHALSGRDSRSDLIINRIKGLMPSGSGFGQSNCAGTHPSLPAGVTEFSDTCNHLHVQITKGTP